MSDNINVEVKRKNPSIPPKNLRELTKQVSEIEGTIDDINESVEEAEQDVNEIKRAINNSDDFVIRDNKFKRKNKAYNPAQYSGLGEIYLEKNETFLGREFDEFVVNVNVPDPTAIAETFEGLVYDRHRKEFLAYELVDGERVYYAEWIKFDKWESTDDYIPEAGYDFICEDDNKAYRWTEETTPDLIETEAHYGNVLKQEMINLSNTIYHIQYDYDLIGKEITIPEGCVLQFEGGSFKNGELTGNSTDIQAGLVRVFSNDLNLSGSWNVVEAYPEWFGAMGDGITDDAIPFNKIKSLSNQIILQKKTYKISQFDLNVNYATFAGNDTVLLLGNPVDITYCTGAKFVNLHFRAYQQMSYLIKVYHYVYHLVFDRCSFAGDYQQTNMVQDYLVWFDGSNNTYYNTVYQCRFAAASTAIGLYSSSSANAINILNNEFYAVHTCIKLNAVDGCRIENNTFQDFISKGIVFDHSVNGSTTISNTVLGNYFEGSNTALYDIDFIENDRVDTNYVIGNYYSLKTQSGFKHIHGDTKNIILETTSSTLNIPNRLQGIITLPLFQLPGLYVYNHDDMNGAIVAAKEENGETQLRFLDRTGTHKGWKRVFTSSRENQEVLAVDAIQSPSILQYYGGFIQVGKGGAAGSNRLTFDGSYDLLVFFDSNSVKHYIGTCEAVELNGQRPTNSLIKGRSVIDFNLTPPRPIWWNGTAWIDATGVIAGTPTSGTFANKPTVSANNIPIGFKYFCTDKQTTEGATNGIEIIHKGNDVWVDALGRTVS